MTDIARLESEALALPAEARAALAQRLLLSLDEVDDAEFERLWGEESAHRLGAFDAGRGTSKSADEVALKARALLR